MIRLALKQTSIIALCAGLVLRALTPLGYMPASPGSGLLFELCPDQLPAGFEMQGTDASAHHHHNGLNDSQSVAEPDQCQIGHLLFSAIATGQATLDFSVEPAKTGRAFLPNQLLPRLTTSVYQSRAPPHLDNKQINS